MSDYFNDDTEVTIEPEERLPHLYILVGFKFSQSFIINYENVELKILKSLKSTFDNFFNEKSEQVASGTGQTVNDRK